MYAEQELTTKYKVYETVCLMMTEIEFESEVII